MPQIFHRSFNSLVRVSIVAAVLLVGGTVGLILTANRTPYLTDQGMAPVQPIPFSHEHHVRGVGIDCRYCHTSVETGAFAGIPTSKTCMTCHSQIFSDAPMLEPLRESFRTDKPLDWVRVHDLPDFVYFDHSIHIAKGVSCVSCHGDVEKMPLMWKANTLNMDWCIECHRDPKSKIGPREAVFLPKEQGEKMLLRLAGAGSSHDKPADAAHGKEGEHPKVSRQAVTETRLRLAKEYNVVSKMDCSVCHR